jgi:ABC-type glycerol-3-phosphate transport system substrate-binding protein
MPETSMNLSRAFNWLGLFLLAGLFAVASYRVASRHWRDADPDRPVIRFVHWQLEGGVRDAYDEVAREYMRANPGVRVEQMAIPERAFPSWVRTQLIGGTAPDLITINTALGDEMVARFFTPLTELVNQPNPYNEGTPLAGQRWRETFVDNLSGSAYNQNLLEYYSIPTALFTVRVFYNRDLWREALGDVPEPSDYRAFLAICGQIESWAQTRNRPVSALSGSRYNAPFLMAQLFRSQTQRLSLEADLMRTMIPGPGELGVGYLRGRIGIDAPEMASGLELMRAVGLRMQGGFLQLGRDDATFRFAQGTALMMVTGSWDATSLRQQVPFELGIFTLPAPAADDPDFGRFTLGPASEGNVRAGSGFGLTRQSRHSEQALDFLRFLASYPGSRIFSERSGWLPAVRGIEPDERIAPFAPRIDGAPDGFDLSFRGLGGEVDRIRDKHMHALLDRRHGIEVFQQLYAAEAPGAIRNSLDALRRNNWRNVMRQDTQLAALLRLEALGRTDDRSGERFHAVVESQNFREAEALWIERELTAGKVDR